MILLKKNFQVRSMNRMEVDLVFEWAAKEGWNPGLYDADSFYQTDPNGFFLGLLNDRPIACISAVAYSDSFGFIGFYIVKPEFRGQGFGITIWHHALDYLGKDRVIGLDSVIAQQKNYQKSGFKPIYRHIRYQGVSRPLGNNSCNLVPLREIPLKKLLFYDRQFFPAPRDRFLSYWLKLNNSLGLAAINQGKLQGYGVIRPAQSGYKIGPLFADNIQIAEQIFANLIASRPETVFFLDIPDCNQKATTLIEKYNLKPVFEVTRMYNKDAPFTPIERVFAITSLELG